MPELKEEEDRHTVLGPSPIIRLKQKRLSFIPIKGRRNRCLFIEAKNQKVCWKRTWRGYFCKRHLRVHPDSHGIPSLNVEYQCREATSQRRRC